RIWAIPELPGNLPGKGPVRAKYPPRPFIESLTAEAVAKAKPRPASAAIEAMNYQHDFHAGNFADVFKHIIFACILSRLRVKPTAFRYIDTHAGSGIYDLSSPEAGRTAEWQGGIGKMLGAKPPTEVQEVVAPYLRRAAPLASLRPPRYTGSPAIAKALLRGQDKMVFCEAHPRAFSKLKANLGTDSRAKLFEMNGYMALRAFVPPVERRGLVLIDPPYEEVGELERRPKPSRRRGENGQRGFMRFGIRSKKRSRSLPLPGILRAGEWKKSCASNFKSTGQCRNGRFRVAASLSSIRRSGSMTKQRPCCHGSQTVSGTTSLAIGSVGSARAETVC